MDSWTFNHEHTEENDHIIIRSAPKCVVSAKIHKQDVSFTFWQDFTERALVLTLNHHAWNKIASIMNGRNKDNE